MSARVMAGALALACAMTGATPAEAQSAISRPSDILLAQAYTLYDAGRYKEAAASFERAMQLGIDRPHEAAIHVARSYAKLGNAKQAQRWVEIAALAECAEHDEGSDAARPLPVSSRALTLDALISRLEEAPWQTRPARTPTVKCPSKRSSTTSTT